jgi:hypothetical protein
MIPERTQLVTAEILEQVFEQVFDQVLGQVMDARRVRPSGCKNLYLRYGCEKSWTYFSPKALI